MAKKKKGGPKYYAVAVGRIPGVYYTWPECQAQVSGERHIYHDWHYKFYRIEYMLADRIVVICIIH
jgi:viroplasmin and RNaseH domain-containing protein